MIIVPTIRHSGSHFLVDLLGYDINKTLPWGQAHKATDDSLIFDHISPYKVDIMLPLIRDNLTVIPLRHPFVVAKSWIDRKKDLSELVAAWETLVYEIDPLEPYYLPLDVEDRQDYLDELNIDTGRSMVTDWTPQGVVQNNSALRHKDVTPPAEIYALCKRIKPFLDGFYASW